MKKTFNDTKITPKVENRLLDTATIVFDTNILLNFYKYSSNTREAAFKIIEKVQNRLWMPFQVYLEYHEKREHKITEVINLASNLKKNIKDFFEKRLGISKQSPFYNILNKNQKQTIKEIEEYITSNKQEKFNPDNILTFLENVYKNKVSQAPLPEEIIEKCSNIRKRYELSIPPGYKDCNKKENIYGDALIWLDVIDYAKNNNKDIIWVSDDSKDDWIKNNELRDDLVREFQIKTGKQIKHYTSELFFKKMGNMQDLKLSKANISEISDIVKSLKIQNDIFNSLKIPDIANINADLYNYANRANDIASLMGNRDYLCKCTDLYQNPTLYPNEHIHSLGVPNSLLQMHDFMNNINEQYNIYNNMTNKGKK